MLSDLAPTLLAEATGIRLVIISAHGQVVRLGSSLGEERWIVQSEYLKVDQDGIETLQHYDRAAFLGDGPLTVMSNRCRRCYGCNRPKDHMGMCHHDPCATVGCNLFDGHEEKCRLPRVVPQSTPSDEEAEAILHNTDFSRTRRREREEAEDKEKSKKQKRKAKQH